MQRSTENGRVDKTRGVGGSRCSARQRGLSGRWLLLRHVGRREGSLLHEEQCRVLELVLK